MTGAPYVWFDESVEYKIMVQGNFTSVLADLIGGNVLKSHSEQKITELKLDVKDQAHLCYILNILYDHRCVILNVECIVPPKSEIPEKSN